MNVFEPVKYIHTASKHKEVEIEAQVVSQNTSLATIHKKTDKPHEVDTIIQTTNQCKVECKATAIIINDKMSFNDAFTTARNKFKDKGVFEWRGKLYNTLYVEEWEIMYPKEQDSQNNCR